MRAFVGLGLTLSLAVVATPARAGSDDFSLFVGTWGKANAADPIAKMVIERDGSGLRFNLHAFGTCVPSACDMGTGRLKLMPGTAFSANVKYGTTAHVEISEKFAKREIDLTYVVVQSAELAAVMTTHFTDHSGRADYTSRQVLLR
jgi:hypothetical protein